MTSALLDEREAAQLREPLARFLAAVYPLAAVRAAVETPAGHDLAAWRRLGDELGLLGVQVPEPDGGAGLSTAEACVLLEQTGAALLPGPFFASAGLAAAVLCEVAAPDLRAELLPALLSGESVVTLALAEEGSGWDPSRVRCAATDGPDGPVLTGEKCYVPDGADADVLLVVARSAAGLGVYAVRGSMVGCSRSPMQTLDSTRRQARVVLRDCPAVLLGGAGLDRALQIACVLLAAEAVGGAARCLELSVQHARLRTQFGRPIGSFQAVQHLLADLYGEVQSARAAVEHAARLAEPGAASADELALAASVAKVRACDAYAQVARQTLQVHGGLGFTWEHDAQLYFKRSLSDAQLLGSSREHRARIAELLSPAG